LTDRLIDIWNIPVLFSNGDLGILTDASCGYIRCQSLS